MSVKKPIHTISKAQRRSVIAAILIMVIFSVFYWRGHVNPVVLQFDEECMTLTGPNGAGPVVVQYQDILAASQVYSLEAGTNLSGTNSSKCWFGTWRNDAFGEYTLCASPEFLCYIVLETADGVVVFNYESTDATEHLYTALLELLETKKEGT